MTVRQIPTMAAFESCIERELSPWLEEQEVERRRVLRRAVRRGLPAFLAALISIVAAFAIDSPLLWLFALVAAPALALWGFVLFSPALSWSDAFQRALLLPAGPRYELMAYDSGVMRGVPCEVATARLHVQRLANRHVTRATSHGVLLARFPFPKAFGGVTAVLPDFGGAVNAVRPRPHDGDNPVARVRLDNPIFEKLFEVFSSDQVSARYLLTPAFMERLLELRRQTGGEMRLAFAKGYLHVALMGERSYFSNVSVSDDIRDVDGMRVLAADMMKLDDLVRILRLDAQTAV